MLQTRLAASSFQGSHAGSGGSTLQPKLSQHHLQKRGRSPELHVLGVQLPTSFREHRECAGVLLHLWPAAALQQEGMQLPHDALLAWQPADITLSSAQARPWNDLQYLPFWDLGLRLSTPGLGSNWRFDQVKALLNKANIVHLPTDRHCLLSCKPPA